MLTPPHKCQHTLTTMGQTGDSDAGVAMSLPPPVAGRGQNPALPCTMPQFPPKTQGHSPSPPTRTDFPPCASGVCLEQEGFSRESECPSKTPSQSRRGGKRHPAPSRFHPWGTGIPPHSDRPHPGGIYPKAEVAEGRRGQGSRNDRRDPKSPSLGEGGQTARQKNSPKMEPIKPHVSAPRRAVNWCFSFGFSAKPTQNEPWHKPHPSMGVPAWEKGCADRRTRSRVPA